jgi:hypothetical protein
MVAVIALGAAGAVERRSGWPTGTATGTGGSAERSG